MDTLTPQQRAHCMARVRGKDTKPEMIVRRLLHRMGYRYGLHSKSLPGRPDLVLARHRKVVFVHGCFWHGHEGCLRSNRPASNREFWARKLDRNQARDEAAACALAEDNWGVLTIWECETKDLVALQKLLIGFIGPHC